MLRALIDPEWASNLSGVEIWRFNTRSAESIQDEINLEHLGSLAVDLSTSRIASKEVVSQVRSARHIIDLAFGEAAIQTDTGLLLQASNKHYGIDHQLTNQLVYRNTHTLDHGYDEPWFLPLSGVRVFDTADIKAEDIVVL